MGQIVIESHSFELPEILTSIVSNFPQIQWDPNNCGVGRRYFSNLVNLMLLLRKYLCQYRDNQLTEENVFKI